MPKKTIVEFKEIFAAVKTKPKRPSNISAKDKEAIESDIDTALTQKLITDVGKMYEKDPEYTTDLIAYKISKHLDDPKFAEWLSGKNDKAFQAAIKKIIPGDLSDEATLKQYRKAQAAGKSNMLNLFNARDGQGVQRLFDEQTAAETTNKIGDGFDKNDGAELEKLGGSFKTVIKAGDPVALARANPTLFFEAVMKGFKESVAEFVEAFANKKLRSDLKAACPEEWKAFAAATPMLATLDKVDEKVGSKPGANQADQIDALFDSILDPAVMPLTYVASSSGYRNIDILAGPTQSNAPAMEILKTTGAPGPATDCHNLQNLTQRLIEASLGAAVPRATENEKGEDGQPVPKGKAKGMVLTTKLTGKGLIGSFGGNVFDENGASTGKVFFTGDGSGQDSHSWLVVKLTDSKDGKTKEIEFDPVLGTKGADVVKGIDEQDIKWVDQKRKIAKTPGGKYLVFQPDKNPGPNKVGITSYYIITDKAPEGLGA